MNNDQMAAPNYRAIIEYDGTAYGGFQIQATRATIQGELERVLQQITRETVRVHGAGRTDAGVHARGQVISFRTAWLHGCDDLKRALNALLPRDIVVRELTAADDRFHARFSAVSRVYLYHVYTDSVRSPLLDRYAHYVALPLDIGAMNRAAALLVGERDVAAFGQAFRSQGATIRRVYGAEWRKREGAYPWGGLCSASFLEFRIEANAFLRGMVRRVVGTLLSVGSGALNVEDFDAILVSREIDRAAAPAPACGLCLWQVYYGMGERPGPPVGDP